MIRYSILFFLFLSLNTFGQVSDTPPPPPSPPSNWKTDTTFHSPEFLYGRDSLYKWISANNKYMKDPPVNGEKKIVRIECWVDEYGKLYNLEVVFKSPPELNAEAIRILKLQPPFKPATRNGIPIKGSYDFWIPFILPTDK